MGHKLIFVLICIYFCILFIYFPIFFILFIPFIYVFISIIFSLYILSPIFFFDISASLCCVCMCQPLMSLDVNK